MNNGAATVQAMGHAAAARRRALLAWAGASLLPRAVQAQAQAQGQTQTQSTAGASGASPALDAAAQEAKAPSLPALGQAFALPSAQLLDGQRFEPAMAEGRVLLLYWWASWCPFCALTSPHIDKLWQAQRGRGLLMLTFSIDKRPDEARAYLQRRGYAWPAAWVDAALARTMPKPKGLPVTVVRGRDGRVLQAEGGQLFPEDVEALARHV